MEKQVIVIQDKPYTIFGGIDFRELVGEFMGYDAKRVLADYLDEIATEIEDLKTQIQEGV